MDDVMSMKPGRELDALVGEAMELPVVWSIIPPYVNSTWSVSEGRLPYLKGIRDGCEYDWAPVPRYSTDPAAMMECWMWLNKQGFSVGVATPAPRLKGHHGPKVRLEYTPNSDGDPHIEQSIAVELDRVTFEGDTPAHALALTVVVVARILKDLGVEPQ